MPLLRLPIVKLPLDMALPGLLVAGFLLFMQLFEAGALQVIAVLLAGLTLALVLWAQVHARQPAGRHYALAQTSLNITSHLVAFLLFSVVYGLKLRSLVSGSVIAVIAAILLYDLLSRDADWRLAAGLPVAENPAGVLLLSLAGGLVAGELTWGLNYWAALSTLVGGAFLLVVFYVIHGLAAARLGRKLDRQLALEYGVVTIVGMAAIFASAFFA